MDELEFESFCSNNNIVIKYNSNLPTRIKGFCFYDGQNYNVFINDKHTHSQNFITLAHELIHILKKHFLCSPEHIAFCESETKLIINELNILASA